MQITSTHNLPVSVGNNPQQTPSRRATQVASSSHSAQSVPQTNSVPVINRVRPAAHLNPMFDQSLSHRGDQARRLYQDVALIGEIAQAEAGADGMLVNRLDVVV